MSFFSSNTSTRLPADDAQSVSSSLTCSSTGVTSNTNNSPRASKANGNVHQAHDNESNIKYHARMARSAQLAARTLQSQLIKSDERAQSLQRQLTTCEQRAIAIERKLRACQQQLKDAQKKPRPRPDAHRKQQRTERECANDDDDLNVKMKCRMALIRAVVLCVVKNRRNRARMERYLNTELRFRTVVGDDNDRNASVGLQVVMNAAVHCRQPFNGLTLVRSVDACEERAVLMSVWLRTFLNLETVVRWRCALPLYNLYLT